MAAKAQEDTEKQSPTLSLARGQEAVLRKVGDILLTVEETMAYTGWSRSYLAAHPEIPRTEKPVRFRLSDLDRIIDARTINPLPKRGNAA